ncbi:hypothetical protein D0469_03790 [Peribacillus saganii]|uniref:Uncharacterized protein n=1 Tax=Peribacillus saganii TaxID=2303992 RepID=A0A372LS93_9BACI|nr:hypothetical protein [Peribacillus saganii]RFU71069.1 hypothetical protein D0469_03790 [Peribacillus saganii]
MAIKDQSLLLRLKLLNNMILKEMIQEGRNFDQSSLKHVAEWNSRVINNLVEIMLNEDLNNETALKASVIQMRIAVNAINNMKPNDSEALLKHVIP